MYTATHKNISNLVWIKQNYIKGCCFSVKKAGLRTAFLEVFFKTKREEVLFNLLKYGNCGLCKRVN